MSQTDVNSLYDEIEGKQREINNLLLDLSKIIDDDKRALSIGKDICTIQEQSIERIHVQASVPLFVRDCEGDKIT